MEAWSKDNEQDFRYKNTARQLLVVSNVVWLVFRQTARLGERNPRRATNLLN